MSQISRQTLSSSDPDSKLKTETELTFWYVFVFRSFRTISIETETETGLFHVTFEFATICDICHQNVTKSVLLKKLKKNQSV